MRLLFATLSRGLMLHADDELTLVRLFNRVSVTRDAETWALPEAVVAMELEAEGLEEETAQLFLDVLDADGRFVLRLKEQWLRSPRSTTGLPARRFHAILLTEGVLRIPAVPRLPQRILLRLRLGARDLVTLGVTLT
jgi:hypothetical protein